MGLSPPRVAGQDQPFGTAKGTTALHLKPPVVSTSGTVSSQKGKNCTQGAHWEKCRLNSVVLVVREDKRSENQET